MDREIEQNEAANDVADVAGALRGRKVLVTGGGGFIGGRLIERLLIDCGAKPRAILRSYGRAARLARFGLDRIELVLGSLADPKALDAAVRDCAVVFNCAYDRADYKANISGIRDLIDACLKHGARLVHVSTFGIYEPLPDAEITEATSPVRSGIPYSENKLDLDGVVMDAVKNRGLDAVIVMPTIVYGPGGKAWTMTPATQMATGTLLLPAQGEGLCAAVYVDDVCQVLIRAAAVPSAKGHRYFASGEKPVTWGAFYSAFAKALNRPGPKLMSSAEVQRKNANPLSAVRLLLGDPKRIIRWAPTRALAMWAKGWLTPTLKGWIKTAYGTYKRVAPPAVFTPMPNHMALFSAHCVVNIDRAKSELGYRPSFDFERGMAITGGWVRWVMLEPE